MNLETCFHVKKMIPYDVQWEELDDVVAVVVVVLGLGRRKTRKLVLQHADHW